MIQMRSLAKGNLGKETILDLGLAISRDPTVDIASNLDGLHSKLHRSCGPKIKVFGWLDCDITDALGDLCRLGLARKRER